MNASNAYYAIANGVIVVAIHKASEDENNPESRFGRRPGWGI
jgi:hypothetical protein